MTGSGTISGSIYTYFGDPVKDVKVKLKSGQANFPKTDFTSGQGEYAFPNLHEGYNYTIAPSKLGDWLNGISTFDLILLSRIIRGRYKNLSPYSYIASDINNDQRVSTSDLISLLYVLIGKETSFPNNKSWNFVDADFDFFDSTNPWPFSRTIGINNLSGHSENNDFIAVKIGDLSGNANTQFQNQSETRSSSTSYVTIDDKMLEKGETYQLEFRHSSLQNIVGFQTEIDVSKLDILDIQSDLFIIDDNNVKLTERALTLSCYEQKNTTRTEDDILLSLTVVSKESNTLSNLIAIKSDTFKSEVYFENEEFTTEKVALIFNQKAETSISFSLNQNVPNPFTDQTTISFDSTKKGNATLEIYSMHGQSLLKKQINVDIGENSTVIDRSTIVSEGMYVYKITLDNQIQSKIMIVSK